MFRMSVALLAVLLLSGALADSLYVGRGVNLAQIGASCLLVRITGGEPSLATAAATITTVIAAKAAQDGIPLRPNCRADVDVLPNVLLLFHVEGTAVSYQLHVVLSRPLSDYAHLDVWVKSGLNTYPAGVTASNIDVLASFLYHQFAQAWKQEHRP
jgi:hypothetical protein